MMHLVVRGVSADAVADAIKQPRLQEAVQERFQADAHPILAVVHIVDVAVVVRVVHGRFHVQPAEQQVVRFTVGNEAADAVILGVRAAVAAKVRFAEIRQASQVTAREEAEDDGLIGALIAGCRGTNARERIPQEQVPHDRQVRQQHRGGGSDL